MTRNRNRRSKPPPPTLGSGKPPPAAGRQTRAPASDTGQAPARLRPRDRPGERREAKVSLIYGFHSVVAALKASRRELIRLYATPAAAERLGPEIAARGLETRIISLEEISARAPREAVHQGLLLEARPLAPIDVAELPANGLVLVLDQITDPHNVRRDSAHRRRLRRRRARHHRAPLARVRRRAGEIGLGRARARADLQRSQSGAGARRVGRHGLLADRARLGG